MTKLRRRSFPEARERWLYAVTSRKLRPAAVRLFAWVLADNFNRKKFEGSGRLVAWPAMDRLEILTGLTRKPILDATKKLEVAGLLHVKREKNPATGLQFVNVYTAVILDSSRVDSTPPGRQEKKTRSGWSNRVEFPGGDDSTGLSESRPLNLKPSESFGLGIASATARQQLKTSGYDNYHLDAVREIIEDQGPKDIQSIIGIIRDTPSICIDITGAQIANMVTDGHFQFDIKRRLTAVEDEDDESPL